MMLIILGGISAYFFIHKPLIDSQTKLDSTEQALNVIEKQTLTIENKLELFHKRIQITSDAIEIVNNINPAILISEEVIKWEWLENNTKYKVVFRIKNIGKYKILIENPKLFLSSTSEVFYRGEHVNEENCDIDYYTIKKQLGKDLLEPNQEIEYSLIIVFEKNRIKNLPNPFFCCTIFNFKTEADIINTASVLLNGVIAKDQLSKRANTKYKSIQTISF